MNLRLTSATRESILLIAGLLGLVSYIVFPNLRDPLLLPIYGAMMGMPIVLSQDRRASKSEDTEGEKKQEP